jgi:hypothetical protein
VEEVLAVLDQLVFAESRLGWVVGLAEREVNAEIQKPP